LLLRRAGETADGPLVLFLHPHGKNPATVERGARLAVAAGWPVVAADYRGVGETEYLPQGSDARPWAGALLLGRPLLGQRVFDVIRLIDFAVDHLMTGALLEGPRRPVVLWARGEAALVALFAAVLDDRPSGVVLEEMPTTFVGKHGYRCSPESLLPNVLKHLDVSQAVGACLPRRVLVVTPVGPDGQRVTPVEAGDDLRWALDTAASLGRESDLRIASGGVRAVDDVLEWLRGWSGGGAASP
jgi:hypothetical protein